MKNAIGFDARMIRHSGIGTYIQEVLGRVTLDDSLDFTLFGALQNIEKYESKKVSFESPIYSVKEQLVFPGLLQKHPIDLLHVPHYNIPIAYQKRLIVTVHDLIHLKFPDSRISYLYARSLFELVCRNAWKIIAISNNTRQDLIEILKVPEHKIELIPLGAGITFPDYSKEKIEKNETYCSEVPSDPPSENFSKKESEPKTVLYVGNIRALKNIPMLVNAFLQALPQMPGAQLLLVGHDSMPQYTAQFKQHPNIRFLGKVSKSRLAQLYRESKIFAFPSLYEGFGLPPLEAMSWKVPVVCSNAASLSEVLGDAALTFDPKDVSTLANHLQNLWNNKSLRDDLVAKGLKNVQRFSWEDCAKKTVALYRQALS